MYYLLSLKWSFNSNNVNFVWWRPNRQGYTDDLNQAGIYSADEIETVTNDEIPIIRREYYNSGTVAVDVDEVNKLMFRKCLSNSSENLAELGIHLSVLPEY